MSNSFAFVQNLNDYTDVSASAAQIISLSVNTFTNGPLTYYNVVGYAPTSFATLSGGNYVSLSTVNGVSATTTSNALVIPAGAYITSLIVTNNGTTITVTNDEVFDINTNSTINSGSGGVIISTPSSLNDVNNVGYITSGISAGKYVSQSVPLYINISPPGGEDITAGSLCVYITYVMATNSPVV